MTPIQRVFHIQSLSTQNLGKSIRYTMSLIRKASTSPDPPAKRLKLDPPKLLNYKNGVVLAPMVRSSTLPSRLLALNYGADLVWGPETVDRAIIGSERRVDPKTGVISFYHPKGQGKPVFTCHPIEKPYLIYQIGSADPVLAAQAASAVSQDVSGIDLNCGCPKPFSTVGGMGAALLSTPDLLCDILKSIRATVPPHVSVSCKIRLMPTEEETLDLVRKIVSTGVIRCLTVHCRTRTMRMSHRAEVERLSSIVKLCRELDPNLAVIQNGDCVSREAAAKVREITGCDSVMIATAAESNLSCFREGPLADANTELIPKYIRLASYFGNAWGNSKHCFSQFKSPASVAPKRSTKEEKKNFRESLAKAKYYPDLEPLFGTLQGGKEFLEELALSLSKREARLKLPDVHDSLSSMDGALGDPMVINEQMPSSSLSLDPIVPQFSIESTPVAVA